MNEQFINDIAEKVFEKLAANRVTKEIVSGNLSLPAQQKLLENGMHPASRLNMTSAGGNGFAETVAGVPAVAKKNVSMPVQGMPSDFMQGPYFDFKNPKFSQGTVKNMQNMPKMVDHANQAGLTNAGEGLTPIEQLQNHFNTWKSAPGENVSTNEGRRAANARSGQSNSSAEVLGSERHLDLRNNTASSIRRLNDDEFWKGHPKDRDKIIEGSRQNLSNYVKG